MSFKDDSLSRSASAALPTESLHSPLSLCTVVDARLSSRKEIVSKIKATGLFEDVIEPETLSDALGVLASQNVDTCIVGPTLTQSGAQHFLKSARAITQATDCAFVVVVDERNMSEAESPLETLNSSAHTVLSAPCSARMYADGVGRAVHNAAEKNTSKVKKLEAYFESQPIGQSINKGESATAKDGSYGTGVNTLLRSEENISKLFEAVLGRQMSAKEAAKIPPEAIATLKLLIAEVVKRKSKSRRFTQFARFLEVCIHDWVEDILERPDCDANKRLRWKLLLYADTGGAIH